MTNEPRNEPEPDAYGVSDPAGPAIADMREQDGNGDAGTDGGREFPRTPQPDGSPYGEFFAVPSALASTLAGRLDAALEQVVEAQGREVEAKLALANERSANRERAERGRAALAACQAERYEVRRALCEAERRIDDVSGDRDFARALRAYAVAALERERQCAHEWREAEAAQRRRAEKVEVERDEVLAALAELRAGHNGRALRLMDGAALSDAGTGSL